MAVEHFAGNRITWLSSDTPPTNVPDGSKGTELDTGKEYYRQGGEWVLQNLKLASEITSNTTLTSASSNKYIPVNSATDVEITIDGSVFATNDIIQLEQTGAGIIELIEGTGMTLNSALKSWGQYSVLKIFFKSATVATVIGGSE